MQENLTVAQTKDDQEEDDQNNNLWNLFSFSSGDTLEGPDLRLHGASEATILSRQMPCSEASEPEAESLLLP